MTRKLAAIVEGEGEEESLPLLLRRIAERDAALMPPTLRQRDVIRVPRAKIVKDGELERVVEFAARKVGRGGGVLVLLDADDDSACTLGPSLLRRVNRDDIEVAVVLAVREFESWFLVAAASLAGVEGLPVPLEPPAEAAAIRGAKEWLEKRMGRSSPYRPRLHQAKLTARMDLDTLASDRSFRKLLKEVRRLLEPSDRDTTSTPGG